MENRRETIGDLISLYSYGTENKIQEWLIFKAFDDVDDIDFIAAIQYIGRRKRKGVLLPSEVVDAIKAVRAERDERERRERETAHLEQLAKARKTPPVRCPKCHGGLREGLTCERHGYWRLSEEEARWEFCDTEEYRRYTADILNALREKRRVFAEQSADARGERELSVYERACLKAGVTPKSWV